MRLRPPLSVAAAGEPAGLMERRPTITSGTGRTPCDRVRPGAAPQPHPANPLIYRDEGCRCSGRAARDGGTGVKITAWAYGVRMWAGRMSPGLSLLVED